MRIAKNLGASCVAWVLVGSAACAERASVPPRPMGHLPDAVTTAEPEWLPLAPRAGRPVDRDPREVALDEPRRLTEGAEVLQLAWAPSSRRLGFVVGGAGAIAAAAEVVDVATGARTQVSRPEERVSSLRFLDEDRLAFVAQSGGKRFLVTARVDGAERATLPLVEEPVALGPSAGPEALWLSVRRGEAHALARASVAGGALRVVVEPSDASPPDACARRASVAFVGPDGALRLTSEEGRSPRLLPRESHGRAHHPAFDATGSQLYFVSDRDAVGGELYRVPTEPASWPPPAERLTFGHASVGAPSPDARHLAFASRRGGPTSDLYLARLGGSP